MQDQILTQISGHFYEKNSAQDQSKIPIQNLIDKPNLNVKDFYKGKTILLTGCTGFLGKVILEKLMRSCPDIKKIFIMSRAKRNMEPMARLKQQILASECFNTLVNIHGSQEQFFEFAQRILVPVQGDLIVENLGLSSEDEQIIINEVNVIINSAASVNFDDPLQDALQINYFGSQRMLELAQKCKNLNVFTHISTAYVNCYRKGYLDEIIYNSEQDVENIVKNIMSMSIQAVKESEKKLIGDFPNTYTFSKNLAEKNLLKNHGNVKTVIIRPSIIACSDNEPYPGWTDSLAAAGGLTVLGALGILKIINVHEENFFDIIPADIVTNQIIVCTANADKSEKNFDIFNSASSVQNPLTLFDYRKYMLKAATYNKLKDQKFSLGVEFVKSQYEYQIKVSLYQRWPLLFANKLVKIKFIKNKEIVKNIQNLTKIQQKVESMISIFEFFVTTKWYMENKKIYEILNSLSQQEQIEFNCDVKSIKWAEYFEKYLKGLAIWVLKEDMVAPSHNFKQINLKNRLEYFTDFRRTIQHQINFIEKDSSIYEKKILNAEKYMKFLQQQNIQQINQNYDKRVLRWTQQEQQFENSFDPKSLQQELKRLHCTLQKRSCQFFYYINFKIGFHLIDGLFIDQKGQEKVKKMCLDSRKTRIILMPLYKSYADPIVMHQVNFNSDMELGFTFGHYEDTPKVILVEKILKSSGHLLIK